MQFEEKHKNKFKSKKENRNAVESVQPFTLAPQTIFEVVSEYIKAPPLVYFLHKLMKFFSNFLIITF